MSKTTIAGAIREPNFAGARVAVQPNSGLSITGTSAKRKAIDALVRQLDTTYHQVAWNFDDNGSVDIDISGNDQL